jgi:hypothetical protein
VLGQRDGSASDLGNLDGSVDTSILGVGTVAWGINNRGMVTGEGALKGNKVFHPFLWMRHTGMINRCAPRRPGRRGPEHEQRGEIVGASVSAPGAASGNPRAFLWRQG